MKKKTSWVFHQESGFWPRSRRFSRVAPEFILKRLDRLDWPDRERLQMAVLKSCEGSLDGQEEFLDTAIQDYRDGLARAEYPRELARSPAELSNMSQEELKALREQDRQEYLDWPR